MDPNLLKLILPLIGRPDKQVLTWEDLRAFPREAIQDAVDLGALLGPSYADHVVDPRYSHAPIPAFHSGGRYYLDLRGPDDPAAVEIDKERLEQYEVSTKGFLQALASANHMEADVRKLAYGIWSAGRLHWHGQPHHVVLVPGRGRLHVDRELETVRAALPSKRLLALVADSDETQAAALERLWGLGVVLIPLAGSLGPDLKLQLPEELSRVELVIDPTMRVAYWRGVGLAIPDAAFDVLVLLAQHTGERVAHTDLRGAGRRKWSEDSIRHAIRNIRDGFAAAAATLDRAQDTDRERFVRTVRSVGYQLALDRHQVDAGD